MREERGGGELVGQSRGVDGADEVEANKEIGCVEERVCVATHPIFQGPIRK